MLLYDHLLTLPEEVRRSSLRFFARIFANPLIPGNRFTQCGKRRKRSVSLLSSHTGSLFRLTTFLLALYLFILVKLPFINSLAGIYLDHDSPR